MGDEAALPPELSDLSEEQLAALPPDVASQVRDAIEAARLAAEEEMKARQQRLQSLGQRIIGAYYERVALRRELEDRWLQDIRRYNGQYEPTIEKKLKSREFGSRAFVPLTRRVCSIVEARFFDLIFPTAERNFAITSSPVPSLAEAGALAERLPPDSMIPAGPGGMPLRASSVALAIRELREEAQSRADAMQREVDDQLRECNYAASARRAIHDAVVMGTGVLKGPEVMAIRQKVWMNGRLQVVEKLAPVVKWVPLWNFYPDMSATRIEDSESDIEVHRLTRAQLAQLARQPDFAPQADVIGELCKTEPNRSHVNDQRLEELRRSSGLEGVKDPRHVLLEYHGPVTAEELMDLGIDVGDNPLAVYEGILWVAEANGAVLKAAIEPLDTQERPYSVFCWEEDPASIFGFGLSYELADTQESANSSFRGAMDNMGLSVGAQTVVNDKLIVPDNGKWILEPNKVWRAKTKDSDVRAAFGFFQIDSRLNELLALFDRSKAIMDDVGGPAMAMQGQDAPSFLDTARGASIAWNSSNIWMRRGARTWDDRVTASLIQRFVDWNMQWNQKQEIKGDLQVMARGSTDLLEAEGLVPKMAFFLEQAKGMPMPFKRRVAQLKVMARGMRLDPADVLPDDEETRRIGEQLDNQPPPTDPAVERIKIRELEIQDKEKQRQFDWAREQLNMQTRMAEIASREGLTREQAQLKYGIDMAKLDAMLADNREKRAIEAQMLNAELASRMATGAGV